MSIIQQRLEKIAMQRMPRSQFAEAALPYKERKKKYKDFMKSRASLEKRDPHSTGMSTVVPGAVVGGVAGGLLGMSGGPKGALGAGLLGAGLGAGLGYMGGRSGANQQNRAINQAQNIVRGGDYDKALQEEVINYRDYKRRQEEARRRSAEARRRAEAAETRRQLNDIQLSMAGMR